MMQAHISPSPSSTMTTPSPTFPFRQPSELADTLDIEDLDPKEREERQKAVQKFLERAEFSKLTRALRARLSYANYKATHNLSHLPLPVLENRIQSPSPAPSPTPTPPSPSKRRSAPAATAMPPPGSPSSNLYSALLGAPPQKRPRHIYGPALTSSLSSTSITPSQSPTPADLLSAYSATPAPHPATPRSKARPSSSAAMSSSSSANLSGGPAAVTSSPFSSATGRTVRNAMHHGRARSTLTEKEDMNAAATLTALMYTNRASPRQQQSQQQQHQQPSTHLLPGPSSFQRNTSTLSVEGDLGIARATTPISNTKSSEDADAAELMLYLATSPSPARPTTSSMPRRTPTSMGRILFAGENEDSASGYAGAAGSSSALTSTMSSLSPGNRNGRSHAHVHNMDGDTHPGMDMMDVDVVDTHDDRDGVATPALTFSQSSQESTASSVLAPPPPLRSPGLPYASSSTKPPSSFGASRKLFIDGEDTRRIMGMATGTYTSTSTSSQPPHNRDGSSAASSINGNTNASSSNGFTLGKGIDLVEAK